MLRRLPTYTVANLCPSSVAATATITASQPQRFDKNGVLVSSTAQFEEQDALNANGRTLTSTPYHWSIHLTYDEDGNATSNYVEGVLLKIPLPDGSQWITAGRVDQNAHHGYTFEPDNGNWTDPAPLCAALS